MLPDSELRLTPRPKPPAKAARKSSLISNYPPPPYSTNDSILGSPITVTAKLLESSSDPSFGQDSPGHEEWVFQKSREELTELLLKADGIIKTRESELGLTSAFCKTLYHDNVLLKSKHDALMNRVPNSYRSPAASPLASPHSRSVGLPATSSEVDPARSSSPKKKSTRRISMSPAEFAELSDQNSALLVQIEKLEDEANQADQTGKRKLQKLEKEIQSLREELGKTREVLEEQKKVMTEVEIEEAKKQKKEREERLLAIRNKNDGATEFGVVDFAPPSSASSTFSTPSKRSKVEKAKSTLDLSPGEGSESPESNPSTYFTFPRRNKSPQAAEFALVSQLLAKIRELEETNAEIAQQQQASVAKLRFAQQGAENMKRVYDYFSDEEDFDVEIIPEDSVSQEEPGDTTITFSSLRQTINEDIRKNQPEQPVLPHGTRPRIRSGMRSNSPPRSHKTRKSVVSLFRRPVSAEYPSMLFPPAEPIEEDLSPFPQLFSRHVSPAGSPLISPVEPSGSRFGRSLGSELGSEFGEEWNADSGNHHLRTTSLYSLSGFVGELSGLPSPSIERSRLLDPDAESGLEMKQSAKESRAEEQVPGSPREKAAARSRLLSQTVELRTDRWVNGRLEQPGQERIKPRLTPSTSNLLTMAFDSMVEKVTGSPNTQKAEDHKEKMEDDHRHPTETPIRDSRPSNDQQTETANKKPMAVVGFALDLWLWLQFIIIIIVFLWAMAKRGPKSVLRDTERKARPQP